MVLELQQLLTEQGWALRMGRDAGYTEEVMLLNPPIYTLYRACKNAVSDVLASD